MYTLLIQLLNYWCAASLPVQHFTLGVLTKTSPLLIHLSHTCRKLNKASHAAEGHLHTVTIHIYIYMCVCVYA